MGTKRSLKDDVGTLKKKITEGCAKSENSEGDAGLRSLRKRLKRVQRKISSRAARIAQAAGKKKAKA
jgi:tetrahydromethanopterin S-methyltransferase subunit G